MLDNFRYILQSTMTISILFFIGAFITTDVVARH
jgi:hypothetical protein